jgi:hypothetical protein
MPMPTFPLARLGAFRAELHACFTRRADALLDLADALLCAPAVPRWPSSAWNLPTGAAGAAPMPRWPVGGSRSSGYATCSRAACPTPTRWSSPWT